VRRDGGANVPADQPPLPQPAAGKTPEASKPPGAREDKRGLARPKTRDCPDAARGRHVFKLGQGVLWDLNGVDRVIPKLATSLVIFALLLLWLAGSARSAIGQQVNLATSREQCSTLKDRIDDPKNINGLEPHKH
jgi:hypothetical protein